MSKPQSFRSKLLTRRTYNRPLGDGQFETWEQTVARVIGHQKWLWKRAKGALLDHMQLDELEQLRRLLLQRKASVSGRTLWLGGTSVAMTREASQFNCSFTRVEDVWDVVDAYWLLLQGCGVGFEPITGTLNGFSTKLEIDVVRSNRGSVGGRAESEESVIDGVWTVSLGDSAESWAKCVGKILAGKWGARRLVIDLSAIRGPGNRLRGYGWISSGDETLSVALRNIAEILNKRAGQLLTRIDILDIMNWLGSTLASRRSAEIALVPFTDPEAEPFAVAKKDHFDLNPQRSQSNNSLVFWHRPSKLELRGMFHQMLESGGSEPGFVNGQEAKRRAPWFKGLNPCAEILLGNKSFCNLVEVNLAAFIGDPYGLLKAIHLIARANYRQTCVNLRDEVLSHSWHELNDFLRLCGVGLTGIVEFLDQGGVISYKLQARARVSAFEMADELGTPRPQAVTTVKPSGTLGKIMDTTEGAHRPLGKYIFNNVRFSNNDEVLPALEAAGYHMFDDPYASDGTIVRLPVSYEGVKFTNDEGRWVNTESAVDQLKRYKMLMSDYVDHNCSITISYDPSEVTEIVQWLDVNWSDYVGVSWVLRNDVSKSAEDLGYPYLPQEIVTAEEYYRYSDRVKPVDLSSDTSDEMIATDECESGACPIR